MAMKIPNILWAQRKKSLFVTVESAPELGVKVELESKALKLRFSNKTEQQELELPLFAEIDVENSRYTKSRGIVMYLTKTVEEFWPSLLPAGDKRSYIKVDWSRWVDSDDEDEAKGDDFDMSQFGGGNFDMSKFAELAKGANMGGGMSDFGAGADEADQDEGQEPCDETCCSSACCDKDCSEQCHCEPECPCEGNKAH